MATQELIHEEVNDEESSITEEEYLAKTRQPSMYPTEPVNVEFHSGKVWVTLADGRTIGTPLAWHPFLMKATPQQRELVVLQIDGVWWPEFEDGLSIEGLLAGRKPPQKMFDALWKNEPYVPDNTDESDDHAQ